MFHVSTYMCLIICLPWIWRALDWFLTIFSPCPWICWEVFCGYMTHHFLQVVFSVEKRKMENWCKNWWVHHMGFCVWEKSLSFYFFETEQSAFFIGNWNDLPLSWSGCLWLCGWWEDGTCLGCLKLWLVLLLLLLFWGWGLMLLLLVVGMVTVLESVKSSSGGFSNGGVICGRRS